MRGEIEWQMDHQAVTPECKATSIEDWHKLIKDQLEGTPTENDYAYRCSLVKVAAYVISALNSYDKGYC